MRMSEKLGQHSELLWWKAAHMECQKIISVFPLQVQTVYSSPHFQRPTMCPTVPYVPGRKMTAITRKWHPQSTWQFVWAMRVWCREITGLFAAILSILTYHEKTTSTIGLLKEGICLWYKSNLSLNKLTMTNAWKSFNLLNAHVFGL